MENKQKEEFPEITKIADECGYNFSICHRLVLTVGITEGKKIIEQARENDYTDDDLKRLSELIVFGVIRMPEPSHFKKLKKAMDEVK